MKILFLSISYNRHQENIYTDLIDELISNQHHVTIISSNSEECISKNNYNLIGFRNNVTGTDNFIKKGLSTISVGKQFKKVIKSELYDKNFDLILYATPPITLNHAIFYCKKHFKCKTYLMLKDIFPQNAVDLNLFSKINPLYLYFRSKEKKLYKLSDFIGCMSNKNVEYLLKNNPYIKKDKVGIFYNAIRKKETETVYNHKENTVFLFGGNLGKPQNIEGLLEIIDKLNNYPLAHFIFVGKGSEKQVVIEFMKRRELQNFSYYDFLPRKQFEEILEQADIGMISLDPRFTIPNIPSKLLAYLNMKKPVIAITDLNTDLKEIIEEANCGWWFDARKHDEIIDGIKYICQNKEEQRLKGENGYIYLSQYFDVKTNVHQLEKFMEEKNESI